MNLKDKYDQAMKVETQAEADKLFEQIVLACMAMGQSREAAEEIQRRNLGYYAGYFSDETRRRVEHLFQCEHPVFGAIAKKGPPTVMQAFELGLCWPNK